MALNSSKQTISVLCIFFISLPSCLSSGQGENNVQQPSNLLIISLDGFRWDYLSRVDTPNFHRIIADGGHARLGMTATFVTVTYPNHYTLATGLYAESHGVVNNIMFDPVFNETFNSNNATQDAESKWFDTGAEPIWVTNQKQGGLTGCIQWPGCEAPIKGVTPTHHIHYDPTLSNKARIDQIVSWFTDAANPINLGLIHFPEPDETGHKYGPDSQQVTDMIAVLDKVVGYLLHSLENVGLLEDMNLIITSDHGFAATPKDLVINLDDYIDPSTYRIFAVTPVASILPSEGMEEEIFEALSAGAKKTKTFSVYKKDAIPAQFHYTNNRRIMPILVLANENYTIVCKSSTYHPAGSHGYNNSLQDMHPVFVATGPGFKKGAEITTFKNEDVYSLMCHLMGLEPAANNGSLDALQPLLAGGNEWEEISNLSTFVWYLFVIVALTTAVGVLAVDAFSWRRKYQGYSRVATLEYGVID